jgi:hypothetical protein
VRELQETISAGTIALEISSRNTRVAALQKRWDRLRAGLGLIIDLRGADMADLPRRRQRAVGARLQGEGSRPAGDPHRHRRGLAGRRVAPATSARRPRNSKQWKTHVEEPRPLDASPAAITPGHARKA